MRPRLLMGAIHGLVAATIGLALATGAGAAWAAPEQVAGGIRFTHTDPNATAVSWAGAFNNWSTTANPMERGDDGVWSVVIPLPAGEHQYKFVIDGQWVADPENPVTGGDYGNSVVKVAADGSVVAMQATSNTPYSPKIFVGGRMIGLYDAIYDNTFSRYQFTRPDFDIDLDFGIKVSDALKAHVLTNINPAQEDVQDYRSRLNLKRGSLLMTQTGIDLLAFDSENIGTWDDPLHLVGDMGVFHHPYGYKRQGANMRVQRYGFDGEALFADNFDDRMSTNSNLYLGYRIDNFPNFQIITQPPYTFEADPVGRAMSLLLTQRTSTGFALLPDQASKLLTMDYGDYGRLFGYGDNNKNTFAARIRRTFEGGYQAGILGRTDRGFGFGRMVLAEPVGDSTIRVLNSLYSQEWSGGGAEASWAPTPDVKVFGELVAGARRMSFVNGSTYSLYRVTTISAQAARVSTAPESVQVASADGDHLTTEKSVRFKVGGSWTFAEGDITLRTDVEYETHQEPAWTQAPITLAGQPPVDHARFETVEFQRAVYENATEPLDNAATTWRFGWDRNWRYYLNREVKTGFDVEWTEFNYDPRTSWEHQFWFPTGNFWLENGQDVVTTDRLTLLGEDRAIRVRPTFEVPLLKSREMRFSYRGTFSGVSWSKRPRYAESVFQFGFDLTRRHNLRFNSDTRWAKYDAPTLGLGHGYVSTFNEVVFGFGPGIELSLGLGVDPEVLDPNTNEYAYIGRDVYLRDRNANGFIAETDYLSLAPQIRAAEKALQGEKRIQVQAIVHF